MHQSILFSKSTVLECLQYWIWSYFHTVWEVNTVFYRHICKRNMWIPEMPQSMLHQVIVLTKTCKSFLFHHDCRQNNINQCSEKCLETLLIDMPALSIPMAIFHRLYRNHSISVSAKIIACSPGFRCPQNAHDGIHSLQTIFLCMECYCYAFNPDHFFMFEHCVFRTFWELKTVYYLFVNADLWRKKGKQNNSYYR